MTSLAAISIDLFGNDAPFNTTMDRAIGRATNNGTRAGAQFGSSFGVGFSSPLLNAIGGVNAALGGLQTLAGFAINVSGMNVAAQFGDFRRQFAGITGDVQKGNKIFEEFVGLANSTNFDVPDVVKFGLFKAGQTGDAGAAVGQTQNVLDTAAAIGVIPQNLGRFTRNLAQIEIQGNRTSGVVNRAQLLDVGQQTPSAIARALGISVPEASRRINKSTGNELVAMLKAVGDKNKGLTQLQASQDPFKVARNIKDSAESGIEPTGKLLNTILTPMAAQLKIVTDRVGAFNKETGGAAGLIGIIGGGTFAISVMNRTVTNATLAVTNLNNAILGMAAASGVATIAAKGKATTDLVLAGTGGAAGLGGAAGSVAGRGIMGLLGKVGGFLKSPLGGGLVTMAVGLGATYGGSLLDKEGNSNAMRTTGVGLKGFGTGVGMGALAGGIVGSVVPVIGTAVGSLLGALVGGVTGAAYELATREGAGNQKKPEAAQSELTQATKDLNATMRNMNSKVFGGGARTKSVIGSLDAEYALVRSAQTGWA